MKIYKKIILATGNHKGQVITVENLTQTLINSVGKLPINLSMEFTPSPLDGKIGKLTGLSVSSTNKLYGTFEVPDDVVETLGRPGFSVAWDSAENLITAAAITQTPYKFK